MEQYLVSKQDNLEQVVSEILSKYPQKIIALHGNLGAGKTTFVKYMLKNLGIQDEVLSPTFGLINEYFIQDYTIYHLDLYRLKNTDEAIALGIDDYIFSGAYCFIEWPDKIAELLPNELTLHLNFVVNTDNSRLITVNA